MNEALRATTLLKERGWEVELVKAPYELSAGCDDLAVEFSLSDGAGMFKFLESRNIPPLKVVEKCED
ncbi:MAG: hypothetical protein DDT42_01698 [candidate division WS2 bacterium]|uniref:Putative Se/S carrier protein-like domain-containing protein n=1 Tax=Psychracetigena formicireducens TaxID=2986056 RepID=A0A9E2BJ40_PSYF1|nr:hypothetical protein [Candidatus Psychracetigena formicireducens]